MAHVWAYWKVTSLSDPHSYSFSFWIIELILEKSSFWIIELILQFKIWQFMQQCSSITDKLFHWRETPNQDLLQLF